MPRIQLKKCPFCGGEAELLTNHHVYYNDARMVRCVRCKCKTSSVLVNHPKLTADGLDESTRYTTEEAEQKAAELWNARATIYH